MQARKFGIIFILLGVAGVVYLQSRRGDGKRPAAWAEVAPGVLRSSGSPASYALVADGKVLLIDAAVAPTALRERKLGTIDLVLLTHHHRDSAAHVAKYLDASVTVRAPKASAPWLTPDGVKKYWKEAIPLRTSRTAYLVVPEGFDGIDCSLVDKEKITWGPWTLTVLATPGHSPDHVAFLARKGKGPLLAFCGDALVEAGKMWSPYTTDWDHWTDAGLKPAAASLRKLAKAKPDKLLSAHGPVIERDVVGALERTAKAVDEVAFLKSYERYTKERKKSPPKYAFLAPEQKGSNGSKPWSRISPHLYLTGNTYVLVSKDGPCLVVDPWSPHSDKQVPLLQKEKKIGKVEVVLCSHAHFDHYDGAYLLLDREKPKVWTLDRVARPIADPYLWRAPFLDPRPLHIDRRFRDGEVATWREYRLKFHHLPGQTDYTMGVETTIDGKRCLFTADNFFHHDLYSGTGGWMGLNSSGPLLYAQSARKVFALRPDWVLAEHGSAMEFNPDDFQRRVDWAEDGARAADALSPSGDHRHDWNPHHVRIEPVRFAARAGEELKGVLVVNNPLGQARKLEVKLHGRGRTPDQAWNVDVSPDALSRRTITITLADDVAPGRHVLPLVARAGDAVEPGDGVVVVDVKE